MDFYYNYENEGEWKIPDIVKKINKGSNKIDEKFGDDVIYKFRKLSSKPVDKDLISRYFVRFVLFNNSITDLFGDNQTISAADENNKVKVNIFQLSKGLPQDSTYMNRKLTDVIPTLDIGVWLTFDSTNFYTQFKNVTPNSL